MYIKTLETLWFGVEYKIELWFGVVTNISVLSLHVWWINVGLITLSLEGFRYVNI